MAEALAAAGLPAKLDARTLSRYAAALDLSPARPSEAGDGDAGLRAGLKDLLRRREQLVAQQHIAWLHEEIAGLEGDADGGHPGSRAARTGSD